MEEARSHLPKRSTIVISFVGPEGKQRHIGCWSDFKTTYKNIRTIIDVETLYDYTKRMKPLNDNHGKENTD